MASEVLGDDDFTIVKLRGLPWKATEEKITEFFAGLEIQEGGILIHKNAMGRASGEGYVEFVNNDNAKEALEKNKEKIDHRYIEIFKTTEEDRDKASNPIEFDISNTEVDEDALVIRMRGLPWSADEDAVIKFFSPVEVSKVHIIPDHMGRASGEGFVEFEDESKRDEALKKDRDYMEGRYIELFSSQPNELALVLARLNPTVTEGSLFVKMRGLPYSATEPEVRDFFDNDTALRRVHFISDINGRPMGDAFVEFDTEDAREAALEKNKNNMGSRYIDLFKATVMEFKATLRRPTNYRRRGRGGRGDAGTGGHFSSQLLTKGGLDADIEAYQKKRKVEQADQ